MARTPRKSPARAKKAKAAARRPRKSAARTATTAALRVVRPPALSMRVMGLASAPKPTGAKQANTVLYIHGIGNKPKASVLKCQWDTSLFGNRVGDRSRMAYWVNREYYPTALDETCAGADHVEIDDDEVTTRSILALARAGGGAERVAVEREIESLTSDRIRQAWLKRVADKIRDNANKTAPAVRAQAVQGKVLFLPEPLRRLITEQLTRAFLRDVNDFLFVEERREEMERALTDRISAGGGPFVVIAHSQGSMIAYDVLRRLSRAQCEVPLFITLGSPLGLQEVQDVFHQWTGPGRLPFPPCVDRWINVADRLDPVALDAQLANDFQGAIKDEAETNPDSPRHPHSATGYLRTKPVQDAVRSVLGTAFQQAIAPFALAQDLVAELEDGHRQDRHPTLIQLVREGAGDPASARTLNDLSTAVQRQLEQIIIAGGDKPEDAKIDTLRHFVVAKLTRLEAETMRSYYDDLKITGLWRNAKKKALITDSTHTVQARPANIGYGAQGKRIGWAVLDTGIAAAHPHFDKHANVIRQFDCTGGGAPKQLDPDDTRFGNLDGNGHGTHVAGIIGGELELKDGTLVAGMAPQCSLYGFKVLNDEGEGDDAWIIKALDKVAALNESAGSLVIQGVNLSLGGNFDPSVFGCGHTPLCQELRRLWHQGVLVCLAAGNEGYAVLATEGGNIQANLDLTIGDPANLDEAIAVGSVHKTNPHTYGISYFSSRGPTADGRRKPDVVAPGEKIISARHDFAGRRAKAEMDNLYVEMSGTSMACPHVSGVLAAFLSIRREFIGYPDRVKKMLLDGCIDLARDPYMQGAGLPNLIKMLALN
jgi:subtilisin family serine protease